MDFPKWLLIGLSTNKEDTTMTNMDKMAEKIQNLLNKTTANGATEEEAKSALLMAQKLMAKYNIDLAATTGNKELKCSLEQTKVKANPRNNSLGWLRNFLKFLKFVDFSIKSWVLQTYTP